MLASLRRTATEAVSSPEKELCSAEMVSDKDHVSDVSASEHSNSKSF